MTFDIALYNDEFFQWHVKYARQYSIDNMNWFIDEYKPESVIDFGCGIGSYLEAAWNKGVVVKGYDISETAAKYTPKHLLKYIQYKDCTQPLFSGIFDMVISFETAEHINPAGTDQFIDNLVSACGKYLLFTAAPPEQGGLGHINCQPKEYWVEKITSHGMALDEDMSAWIAENWKQQGCPFYIEKNLLVFIKI